MAREFQTLDVFTTQRFGGNPLAVVRDGRGLSTEQMQTIAAEFNLSETTFILPPADEANDASVRIFTPKSELPFAGHPTVGTAIAICQAQAGAGPYSRELRLEEQVGLVPVTVTRDEAGRTYAQFTCAVLPQAQLGAPKVEGVAAAINVGVQQIGFHGHEVRLLSAGVPYIFVPVSNMESLERASPSLDAWRKANFPAGMVGVFAYTRGGVLEDTAWHGRMFAPDQGVMEDPATGSAAATFPGQIMASEQLADGLHTWTVEQGYEMGRPSQIYLEADVAGGQVTGVRVGGYAVPVMRGELLG